MFEMEEVRELYFKGLTQGRMLLFPHEVTEGVEYFVGSLLRGYCAIIDCYTFKDARNDFTHNIEGFSVSFLLESAF